MGEQSGLVIDDLAERRDAAIAKANADYERDSACRAKGTSGAVVYRGVLCDWVFSAWYDGGVVNDDGSKSPAPDDAVYLKGHTGRHPRLGDPAAIDTTIDAMYEARGMTPPPIPDDKPWAECMAFKFRYREGPR